METPAAWTWRGLNAHEGGGVIVADFVGYNAPDRFIGSVPAFAAVMQGRGGQSAVSERGAASSHSPAGAAVARGDQRPRPLRVSP